MKVEGDFSQISSNFEPLTEAKYHFKLISIEDQTDDPDWKAKNATSDKQPALIFISEVVEGDREGAQVHDYLYMKTKKGAPNKIALGRIKMYAEAILGEQAANNPKGIDTDELINGEFDGLVKIETYQKDNPDGSGTKVPGSKTVISKTFPRG